MRIKFFFSLLFLSSLVVASYVLEQRILDHQQLYNDLIHRLNHQRMLSQRAGMLSLQALQIKSTTDRLALGKEIYRAAEDMRTSQKMMLFSDFSAELGKKTAEKIHDAYLKGKPSPHLLVTHYHENLFRISGVLDTSDLRPDDKALQFILANRDQVLAQLSNMINLFERLDAKALKRMQRIEIIILVAFLCIAAFLYFAIFAPMSKNLTGQLEDLREKNYALLREKKKSEGLINMRGDFLIYMSQSFEVPLRLARTAIQQWQAANPNLESTAPTLEASKKALAILESQMHQIITMGRIDLNKTELTLTETSFQTVLEDVRTALSPTLTSLHVTLSIDLSYAPPKVFTDSVRLQQILTQILQTLAERCPQQEIQIHSRSFPIDPSKFRLVFVQQGQPFTQKELSMIFEPFLPIQNLAPEAKPVFSSDQPLRSNLNLSLAKRICDLLQISLKVTNEPGLGTEISLVIPKRIHMPVFSEASA